MQIAPLTSTLRNYWEVTKPNILSLLIFTSLATMFIASKRTGQGLSPLLAVVAIATITLGCAGCNVLTCYIDRDIDALMKRTRDRPLPSKRIHPPEKALYFGLAITVASLILALWLNVLAFLFLLLGVLDNVVVYSLVFKRRNPLNILLGGFSGGMPVLFGWAAVANEVSLTPILLSALVFFWIPAHIWSLALFYKEDYERAGVPMLPTVVSLRTALRSIVLAVLIMFPISILIYFFSRFSLLYLIPALVLGIVVVIGNLYLFFKPTRERAWTMFKISSPYLFILFSIMVIDAAI